MPIYSRMAKYITVSWISNIVQPLKRMNWVKLDDLEEFSSSIVELKEKNL